MHGKPGIGDITITGREIAEGGPRVAWSSGHAPRHLGFQRELIRKLA